MQIPQQPLQCTSIRLIILPLTEIANKAYPADISGPGGCWSASQHHQAE